MRESKGSAINRIFCEVLERQAFLFPEPLPDGDFQAGEDGFLMSSIRFSGETPGALSLAVPESLAREIAANVMGTEGDDPQVEANFADALNEILNVLCGHVLTALHGDHAIFDLSIPETRALTAAEAMDLAGNPGCLRFDVEGRPALLCAGFP